MTDDVMRELESGDLLDALPEETERAAYFIEVDTDGCSKCGKGRTWRVVGPDGMADSVTYGEEYNAERHADRLNAAFSHGRAVLEAENARLRETVKACEAAANFYAYHWYTDASDKIGSAMIKLAQKWAQERCDARKEQKA